MGRFSRWDARIVPGFFSSLFPQRALKRGAVPNRNQIVCLVFFWLNAIIRTRWESQCLLYAWFSPNWSQCLSVFYACCPLPMRFSQGRKGGPRGAKLSLTVASVPWKNVDQEMYIITTGDFGTKNAISPFFDTASVERFGVSRTRHFLYNHCTSYMVASVCISAAVASYLCWNMARTGGVARQAAVALSKTELISSTLTLVPSRKTLKLLLYIFKKIH